MTGGSFETIVIGDGIAGWAAAAVLARRGQAVAVLGRAQGLPPVGEYLPPEGVAALAALGLDGVLRSAGHRPSGGTVSIWGSDAPLRRDVLMQPGGRAYCVDRRALEADLRRMAEEAGAVAQTLSAPPAVTGGAGAWQLDLRGGPAPLTARFLIDATGRAAWLARALGARVTRRDDLTALAMFWSGAPTEDAALRSESLPDGWCYAAPLSGERLVTVFLTHAAALPRGTAARRALALERIAGSRLAGVLCAGARAEGFRAMAAGSQLTKPGCGLGWAAIGDAAMAFDPLASAGMTKALLDIRETVGGRALAPAALAERRRDRFAAYLAELRDVYAAERRFGGPFWTPRQSS
ncbi:MAG: NAD(P)/FAD-dependent oxidoreductase [Salipiger thiooxidans]|uniref:NAD(P)/FAD-dependent oxidoreductase n=1 Tax=Salipiger thiooxidans TaxID=282683 RepID=UPI001CFBE0E9|nr:FAD-dependent monooxygenase [Salipiger thiooxidans]